MTKSKLPLQSKNPRPLSKGGDFRGGNVDISGTAASSSGSVAKDPTCITAIITLAKYTTAILSPKHNKKVGSFARPDLKRRLPTLPPK